jgi:hypothetical protein
MGGGAQMNEYDVFQNSISDALKDIQKLVSRQVNYET